VLKQVLKQAGSNSHPQVGIRVGTPFAGKAPHFIRLLLNVLADVYDRLPSRIKRARGSLLAWENPLRSSYCLGESHTVRQRPELRHAGPTSVNREAELRAPSRVAWGDLLALPMGCSNKSRNLILDVDKPEFFILLLFHK
jgi:hypothetical protein